MTAEALLTSSVVDIHNLISRTFVTPSPIQDDKPEIKWEWGDLLHWRTTGRFTRTISEIARKNNNPQWLAYACGYKTHVATDFVGHPYVNQVAGGPGRSWVIRHHLAENFMDAYVFNTRGLDINTARVQRRMEPLRGSPDFHNLAQLLSGQLLDAVNSSINTPNRLPTQPSVEKIEDALDTMLSLFRFVTEDNFLAPPKRPDIIIPPLPGATRKYYPNIGKSFTFIKSKFHPNRFS